MNYSDIDPGLNNRLILHKLSASFTSMNKKLVFVKDAESLCRMKLLFRPGSMREQTVLIGAAAENCISSPLRCLPV